VQNFLFLKFITQLVTPPGLLALGLVLGAVCMVVGLRRLGRLISALGVAQAVLFSLAPVSDALMIPLENEARRMAAQAPPCCYDSIVVLGGAVRPPRPPARPDPDLAEASDRVWYAARLFKLNVAPRIILSGGPEEGPWSEAAAMRVFLIDLGVPSDKIVLESRSINTIGNIREVKAIVGAAQVALVTSGYHMPRAMRLARVAGLKAQAFPTDWRGLPEERQPWIAMLPSIDATMDSWIALKEHIATTLDVREEELK